MLVVETHLEYDSRQGVFCGPVTLDQAGQGRLYLSGVLGLYSSKVVHWNMSSQMTKELVALHMAIIRRCSKGNILHHSDHGSRYCSEEFQRTPKLNGFQCSMSRKRDR